eukprot:CAMPEP_0202365908 /NCGR_PEP_ID=MMETSP1126-20121109/16738_1 /ASSEMBLY_ACC=CAM_ASM_000457 /TAXON_ID=3047 /ORGANISM="Dunaliella tertiolecta, Strain CCMP1320" /LENGTH=198 /DNA_ID=CAMNT_0048960865 /DNA_START=1 /DNA_END=595 /DNA_ORIENTATION=+
MKRRVAGLLGSNSSAFSAVTMALTPPRHNSSAFSLTVIEGEVFVKSMAGSMRRRSRGCSLCSRRRSLLLTKKRRVFPFGSRRKTWCSSRSAPGARLHSLIGQGVGGHGAMPGCVCTIFFTVGPGEQLRVIHGVKAAVAAAAEGAVWLEGILEGCVGGVGMVVPVHAALLQVLLLCGIQLIAVHGADCTAAMLLLLSHW